MELARTIQRAAMAASSVISDSGGVDAMAVKSRQAERSSTEGKNFFRNTLDVFDSGMTRGLGGVADTILDKIGCPDELGDVVGVVVNLASGNVMGAALNGLDLAENIARKNGNEELAGYLTAAMNGGDMVASVATKVALVAATGGAAGVGIGAAGGTASVGSLSMSAQGLMQTASMVRGGFEAGDKFQQGDFTGGAVSAFAAMANIGPLGEMLGASPEALETVAKVATHGSSVAGFLDGAMADGEFTLSDLRQAPLQQLMDATGLEVPRRDGLLGVLLEAGAGMLAGQDEGSLVAGIIGGGCSVAGIEGADAEKIGRAASFLGQLINAHGEGDGSLASTALQLLKQGALSADPKVVGDYVNTSIRL